MDSYLLELRSIAAGHHAASPTGLDLEIDSQHFEFLSSLIPCQSITIDFDKNSAAFANKEVRDYLAAEYYSRELIQCLKEDKPKAFDKVASLHLLELGNPTSVAGRALALVHNEIDIFKAAIETFSKTNPFHILRSLSAAMQYLEDIPIESLCRVITTQDSLTRNDYCESDFFNSLESVLKSRPVACRNLLEFLRESVDLPNLRTYQIACLCLMPEDHRIAETVVADYNRSNNTLKQAAILAAGSILLNPCLRQEHVNKLLSLIQTSLDTSDTELRSKAMFALSMSAELTTNWDEPLIEYARKGDPMAIVLVSKIYWKTRNNPIRSKKLIETIEILSDGLSTTELNCTYFDYLLSDLLGTTQYRSIVFDCLQKWIISGWEAGTQPIIERLPMTLGEILQNESLLSTFITRLFIGIEIALPLAIQSIVGFAERKKDKKIELRFDHNLLSQLNYADFQTLVTTISAFIFDYHYQLSLVRSLLNLGTLSTLQLGTIKEFLLEDIGYEYPYSVIQSLDDICKTVSEPAVVQMCGEVKAALEIDTAEKCSLKPIPELTPPALLETSLRQRKTKRVKEQMKLQASKSPLQMLATTIPIKAGRGFFSSKINSPDNPSRGSTIRVTQLVPRSLAIDVVGLEMRRQTLLSARSMKK